MNKALFTISLLLLLASASVFGQGKHLFILSGQSNMQGLRPHESFTPAVEAEFGKENVIVVIDALGGQPIRRWYKNWKPLSGNEPVATGDLYDSLMNKVNPAIVNEKIETITFVWMQGERDASEKHGDVYKESLIGLYNQLSKDLNRDDINFVNGRLSDFDMANAKYPHWTMIRDIQVEVAESNPHFVWINTDDLNDGVNRNGKAIKDDLHMSAKGYIILGERFANAAIKLIKSNLIKKNDGIDTEDAIIKSPTLQSTEKGYKVRGEIKYKQPAELNDGINISSAEQIDINLPLLMKTVNEIEEDNQNYKKLYDSGTTFQKLIKNGCIESFLLYKDGALILEEYYGFSDIDIPHYQMSITKSVASYAMGIAIDQRKVKSENDFILDYLPEVDKNKLSENSKNIRIKDVLSMQSGIRLSDLKYKETKVDIDKRVEQILTHSNTLQPGTEYKYYSIDPEITVHILYNTTKIDMADYVGKNLFKPMGITNYSFDKERTGLTKAAAGMKLRSRDMLKLGILNLDKGKFNGKRIISSKWVKKANGKYADNGNNKYGYYWWTH
ncbi:MAG: serine hydrolase [Draconibacterium sp.]|nr:serine hydrolase [Draconibacterium sp.]